MVPVQRSVAQKQRHFSVFSARWTEGDMGGPVYRNTGKKVNEHRITARKVNETPSPQHVFS